MALALDWQIVDGRPECVGLHLTSTGQPEQPALGVPVTFGLVRDTKFTELIRRDRAAIVDEHAPPPAPTLMRRSARARLEETARIYREAYAAGLPPTQAVADHFGITRGGASSLVARAREAGLLPPTSPGASHA